MSFREMWSELVRPWRKLRLPVRLALTVGPVLLAAMVLVLVLILRPRPQPMVQEEPFPRALSSGWFFSFPTMASTGSPATLLDDGRLFYEPGWGALEVRRFLESRPGRLRQWRSWVGDQEVPLADVIAGKALLYGINPKVLLALLEFQNGLVDDPNPPPETFDWAMGYHDEALRGLEIQLDRAARDLFLSRYDYATAYSLTLGYSQTVPLPAGTNLGSYVIMRLVAQTGDEFHFNRLQGSGEDSFVRTYRRLFGEDPRLAWEEISRPLIHPFLAKPYVGDFEVTSMFDHDNPFLSPDGSLLSHLGDRVSGLPGDGHNGWDYALDVGVPVLAAADGVVAWAGNSDDRCATVAQGLVLDHGNGYQTLYWHLSRVDVQIGQSVSQGDKLGLSGASGCAEGPHLHFEVHLLGRDVDPEGWCGSGEDPWAVHPAGMVSYWLWGDRFSPCQWPVGAVVVDDADNGFQQAGTRWNDGRGGVHGATHWAPSEPRSGVVPVGDSSSLDGIVEGATWRPSLPGEGRYHVYAFIPYWYNGLPDTQSARYVVHYAEGKESLVVVDQSVHLDRWVDLGVYSFAGGQGFVYLDNLTDEVGFAVWFDAVIWVPE